MMSKEPHLQHDRFLLVGQRSITDVLRRTLNAIIGELAAKAVNLMHDDSVRWNEVVVGNPVFVVFEKHYKHALNMTLRKES